MDFFKRETTNNYTCWDLNTNFVSKRTKHKDKKMCIRIGRRNLKNKLKKELTNY